MSASRYGRQVGRNRTSVGSNSAARNPRKACQSTYALRATGTNHSCLPTVARLAIHAERRLERETGIEPATNSLEGCDSTTELLPPPRSPTRLSTTARYLALRRRKPAYAALVTPSHDLAQPRYYLAICQAVAARAATTKTREGALQPRLACQIHLRATRCSGQAAIWLANRSSRSEQRLVGRGGFEPP